jgi:hypothetical protein
MEQCILCEHLRHVTFAAIAMTSLDFLLTILSRRVRVSPVSEKSLDLPGRSSSEVKTRNGWVTESFSVAEKQHDDAASWINVFPHVRVRRVLRPLWQSCLVGLEGLANQRDRARTVYYLFFVWCVPEIGHPGFSQRTQ